MLHKLIRHAETSLLTTIAVTTLYNAAWAGPPPPPVIAEQLPRTPVGGIEVTVATAVGIAAYGLWRSRK